MDVLVVTADILCWGTVVVVWIVTAVRDAGTRTTGQIRGSSSIGMDILASVSVAAIVLLGRAILAPFTVEADWVRVIGVVVLVASTLFAIWARLALGSSWSVGPRAVPDRGLRTDGPYAITRHPIYTGLLGMLLGSAILGGLGQWLVLVLAGLVVFESRSGLRSDCSARRSPTPTARTDHACRS